MLGINILLYFSFYFSCTLYSSEGSITSGGKTIGGFETTILRSTEGDTVFRIKYHDNVAVKHLSDILFQV